MRASLFRHVAVVLVWVCAGAASVRAEPRGPAATSEVGDKGMDKQMDWEKKVMGDDSAKRADMKKIAAAQKLAAEARKHPAPEPVAKVKDPSKEGVRAKHEASIGLPIASDDDAAHHTRKAAALKKAKAPTSDSDELGALVASSLAAEKGGGSAASSDASAKGRPAKIAKGKHPKASSLDDIFANQGN